MLAEITVFLKEGAVTPGAQLAIRPLERNVYSSDPCTPAPTSLGEPVDLHPLPHEVFFAAISRGGTEPLRQDCRELGSRANSK